LPLGTLPRRPRRSELGSLPRPRRLRRAARATSPARARRASRAIRTTWGDEAKKKKAKENQQALRAAKECKVLYNKVVTTQMARVKELSTSPEWAMISNKANFKQLDMLFKAIVEKCNVDFTKEWMSMDELDIKKKYSGDHLYFELRKMADDLNPVLEDLDKFHCKLYRMQQASVDA
jgi:hypothetical protein